MLRQFGRGVGPEATALQVLRHAAATLADAVPADFWCGVLLDPSTLLDTGGLYDCSFPDEVLPRLFEIEHVERTNADNLHALARRRSPVTVLSESTAGNVEGDVYYQDVLRPLGMSDEMRVLLRNGPNAWGLLVWCRRGPRGFSGDEVRVAAALGAPAANALRGSLLVGGTDDGLVDDAPGLLLLDHDASVISESPTARRWMDELLEEHPDGRRLPNVVRAVAARARAARVDTPVRSSAMTRSGQWVTLNAWALDGPRVAVSIGPAGVNELVAIVLDVYNLTARERDVTQQVLRGRGTTEIAAALAMSRHTVEGHLKSIFEKSGVRSCRELMSEIFGRHYLPRLGPGAPSPPLSTDGRLYEKSGRD